MLRQFFIFIYVLLAVAMLSDGAVYTILSTTSSNLYICASGSTRTSSIILRSDSASVDSAGNLLCYWAFDSAGHVSFAGGDGTLVIEATADGSNCSTQSFSLNTLTAGRSNQLFGWVNSPYGSTIGTSGGNGICVMDIKTQASGGRVMSGLAGASESQSFTVTALVCSEGSYWNQAHTSPLCVRCPAGTSLQ
jgi:hypothetical protein